MSGVAIVRYLLANNAGVLAVVPATRIKPDLLINTVFPAIAVNKVDAQPRNIVSAEHTKRLWTERVQVTALAKAPGASPAGAGYAGVHAMLLLILAACPHTRGTVNGIYCDSVLPDGAGPDLYDDVSGIHSCSQDFIVKWIAD